MDNPRILVVDDEFNTRDGILWTLEQHYKGQCELYSAEQGLEALDLLRKDGADLVISDIRMPGIDGLELLESVRQERIETGFILLSGYAEFAYAQRAISHGIGNYLLKPIDREKLMEAVNQALIQEKERRRMKVSLKLFDEWMSESGGRTTASDNHAIEQAKCFIQSQLNNPLGIKDVAQHVHLSPSYFSVLFKEKVGVTFSEYVSRVRHLRAKELLLTSDKEISVIAEEVGYQSASYFIRVFRELEGVTPKHYRRGSPGERA